MFKNPPYALDQFVDFVAVSDKRSRWLLFLCRADMTTEGSPEKDFQSISENNAGDLYRVHT